jgi:hypothetical protein
MQLSWRCYETFVQPLKEGVVMKRMKVLLPIFVVVFALLLTACGGSSQSGSSSPSPTLTPAPTRDPTRQPTAKPATATGNLTATYGTPRLGGPVSDFIGKYGQPDTSCSTCAKGVYNFQRIQGTQTDYISTMLTDANGHVNSFLVQSPGADWDVTTATAICESFGPSDVNYDHPLKVLQSSDGSLVEKVYKSAWLAGQLAKSDFQDGNTMSGNIDLPPGMFDISYSGGPSKVSDCVLAAGIERV